jgi:uncharacterized linocin/CFP29 family protein
MPNNNNGRDQVVQWRGTDIWARIDKAVHDEMARTRVGAKFIPLYGPLPPGTRDVPADQIASQPPGPRGVLSVQEGDDRSLVELSVQFTLTQAQVEDEHRLGTAVTLATRAANILARAEDTLIFPGVYIDGSQGGTPNLRSVTPLDNVQFRGSTPDRGLVQSDGYKPATGTAGSLVPVADTIADVTAAISRIVGNVVGATRSDIDKIIAAADATDSVVTITSAVNHNAAAVATINLTNALAASAAMPARLRNANLPARLTNDLLPAIATDTLTGFNIAYSKLQNRGYYGPFALVLPRKAFAEIHQPSPGAGLATPADSIRPLAIAGLYHTGVLPDVRMVVGAIDSGIGVVVAVGGDTVDLPVGIDATTAFTQVDDQGQYRFRVYERLALRVKKGEAIVVLKFENP